MPAENGENLVKDIKKKEQEVQKTELKSAQESNVFDPEQFEKTRTSEVVDIVKEEIVIRELDKIEGKINKSPLSKEYKDQISKKLDGKINEWKSSINKVDEKYAEELKMVFGEIVNELKNFNQNKEVKEIYEVVEPYFQNKFLVEQAIKVKVYGRGSGDWQKVNGEVSKITPKLGDIKNVEKLQKILNIDEDGKIGPQTMNALFAMLGSGRKEVQFGQKTILYNEDEIPKPEITPEIQKEIDETFNKLDSKASEIAAKAQTYVDYLMQNGKSAPKHEKDLENYAVSLCELAASCEGIVSLYQKYGMDYPKATIQTKSVTKGSRVLQELKIKIPTTKEEASQLTSQFQAFLLNVRTEYYMETSDENYEQYGRESRVQEREMRNSEAQQLLDQAKGEDSKINGVDEAERVKVESKVSSAMAGMTQDLDSMKGMLANDYQAAYKFGLGLNAKFGETLEGKYDLYGIKSEEISKFPGLKNALSTSAKSAQEQLDQLLVKSINNKDVEKLKQDSTLFVQKTNLYIQSLEVLFKQIEAGQTPSEEWMKRVREGADGVLNDPLIGSIKNSPARGFIKSLNVLDGKTEAERKFNLKFIETFVNLRKSENMMSEYIEKVTGMCVKISGTEGTTWKDDIWESAKPVLITVAAVAGAVAMGALFLATGGVAAVGVLGVAANIGVGSIVTGFGAAYGARLATAAVEQDVEVLADSKGILKDWAVGSAMSAAGGAFGATVGTGIGRGGAAIAGSKLAPEVLKKAASSTAKYGERMVETSFKVGNAPTTGLRSQLLHVGKELTEETGEELLEDSLQKIGEGMAPNNPVAGFVFSMIPSTLRQSRTSFMKGTGRFQAGSGITGKIAGNGVEFQYTDKDSAVTYMRERGAPEDVLTTLETNGFVDVTVNGVRIKVEQESKVDTEESKVGGGGGTGDDENESDKETGKAKRRKIAGGIREEAEARGNKPKSRPAKNNSKARRAADPKKAGKQEKIDQRRQERRAREAANRANNQTEADRLAQEEAARKAEADRLAQEAARAKAEAEAARKSPEPQVTDRKPEDFKIKDKVRVKSAPAWGVEGWSIVEIKDGVAKVVSPKTPSGKQTMIEVKTIDLAGWNSAESIKQDMAEAERVRIENENRQREWEAKRPEREAAEKARRDEAERIKAEERREQERLKKQQEENDKRLDELVKKRGIPNFKVGDQVRLSEDGRLLTISLINDNGDLVVTEEIGGGRIRSRNIKPANLARWNSPQEIEERRSKKGENSEGVDSKMDGEAIKSYIEKVKSDSSQPKLTRLILSNPMLTPTTTIKVGDRVFYAGPVIATKTEKGGLRFQSIMFTEVNGKLVPRAFYKSNSDGGWRVTPYFNGQIYSKGDNIHYTQETKPHEELSAYLGSQAVNQKYNGDFIQEYFSMGIADEKGEITFNDGLSEVKTFSAEHSRYDDGGKFDGVRQFNPGRLNKDLKNREDLARLEKVTSVENLPDGFVPDFSAKPLRSYQMDHTILTPATGNKITVDVYQGVLDGKSVEWHMAHDSQGRVWVDRINFHNDEYNSYGVVSNLIHSGILTSKPIDYIENTDMFLEYPRFTGEFREYSDITPLIDRMGPIKKFRKQRNIQRTNSDQEAARAKAEAEEARAKAEAEEARAKAEAEEARAKAEAEEARAKAEAE
ncbi:MAG TPA: hypothetical protein PK398_01495, partial [Candidatus Gracilibacteria bacterium]|nr:hypothetical protein [Candidatus Gracilibacteria bacterium]